MQLDAVRHLAAQREFALSTFTFRPSWLIDRDCRRPRIRPSARPRTDAPGTIGLGRMCRPTRKTSARGQAMGPNLAGGLHLQEEVLVGLDVLDLPRAAPYVQTPISRRRRHMYRLRHGCKRVTQRKKTSCA